MGAHYREAYPGTDKNCRELSPRQGGVWSAFGKVRSTPALDPAYKPTGLTLTQDFGMRSGAPAALNKKHTAKISVVQSFNGLRKPANGLMATGLTGLIAYIQTMASAHLAMSPLWIMSGIFAADAILWAISFISWSSHMTVATCDICGRLAPSLQSKEWDTWITGYANGSLRFSQ